uniref:Uncharacterized protein n=1 Tax=Rhizophora mucronata TaxID=61149 RepID=A0A2P2PZ68_RHIMU
MAIWKMISRLSTLKIVSFTNIYCNAISPISLTK